MTYEEYDKITDNEHLEFERIPVSERLSLYRDLCGLLYLTKLREKTEMMNDVISGAGHDVVYLYGPTDELTSEQAIYLSRCGIIWTDEYDSLEMFA